MAEADCPTCEAMGYRSCDKCGNPVFSLAVRGPLGEELCGYCLEDLGIRVPEPDWMKKR
jgi:formylmethanofuran dehydrogenase subunit E